MATTDILYRYFKARQEVNENGHAETLAQCIHYNRGVDAVVLDMKDKGLAQKILKETDINDAFDSWLLDIAGNLVLIYPRETKRKIHGNSATFGAWRKTGAVWRIFAQRSKRYDRFS